VDLVVAWVIFPLVLLALCGGCGLLVDRFTGRATPRALVPVVGFAVIVVVGQFLTLGDATAGLTTPVVAALAVVGFALELPRRWARFEPWAVVAAAAVFVIYAAPIVLSGEPTIAGFIKLDDTATWLALTDRVMEHGRSLDGLAPSTYEATLAFNLGDGYPIGVFLPLGVGGELVGTDIAWLLQPYIAFAAGLLALGLWSVARPLVTSAPLRAATAFVAAQPALLFGYYLWGGVKEVAAAALIAGTAALAVAVLDRPREGRGLVAPVLTSAALVGVLSAGGLIWLAPLLIGVAIVLFRMIGAAATAIRAAAALAGVALLSVPLALSGALLPPTSSPLTDHAARGNLIEPLKPTQVAGVWISGDFRLDPSQPLITYVLIAVACFAAVAGLVWAARAARPGPLIYVVGSLAACAVLVVVGSPWVDGKALATASPAIPFAAMLAIGWLGFAGQRLAAGTLALFVAGGVLWSNALGYRDVSLAPHDQLAELERIGDRVADEGPTLMTEYEPYGVRHFLRDSDAEGISELRRHQIPLTDGTLVDKGYAADTDAVAPAALAFFRTLVLRRSPAESRPPAAYKLIWSGRYYEVWQRDASTTTLPARIGLGDAFDPYGVAKCNDVRNLANQGALVAAEGPEPLIVPLSQASYPSSWSTPDTRYAPIPLSAGTITADVRVDSSGEFEFWLGGSVRPEVDLVVDGKAVGSVREELNNLGGYVSLGSAHLDPGVHRVQVVFHGSDLHPGSGGQATAIGPLVLTTATADESRLVNVPASQAKSLCGKRLDWIEVARP
jgi:hypothetical protein